MICATLWKKNYQSLADITVANKMRYAEEHGYLTHFVQIDDYADLMYVKLDVILQALDKIAVDDWCWFSDCDGVVTNMDRRLEDLAALADGAGIIVANDFNGINSGSMMVKNCQRVRDYFKFILSQKHLFNCEQVAMERTCETGQWCGIVKLVDQHLLNSYDYNLIRTMGPLTDKIFRLGQWQPGDFFIHFPATVYAKRLELCRQYDALCKRPEVIQSPSLGNPHQELVIQ